MQEASAGLRVLDTPSEYWKKINEKMDANLLVYGYENFRNTLDRWYVGQYRDEEHHKCIATAWDYLYETYPKDILDKFSESSEGKPYAFKYKDRYVTMDLAVSLNEYFVMDKAIEFKNIKTIHEVGAGYGRTAYIIKALHPEIKYTIFDIEPSLSIAKKYLSTLLKDNLIEYKSPSELDGGCDLLLTIDCLHEMLKEQVDAYFDYANTCKYFYFTCANEYYIPYDDIHWNRKDYPIKDTWKVLLNQEHVIRPAYFEVLCQTSA